MAAIAACEKKQNAECGQDESGFQQGDDDECGARDQHAQQRERAERS
jgi:hypothetical protein